MSRNRKAESSLRTVGLFEVMLAVLSLSATLMGQTSPLALKSGSQGGPKPVITQVGPASRPVPSSFLGSSRHGPLKMRGLYWQTHRPQAASTLKARTPGPVHLTSTFGPSGPRHGARCGNGGQPWVARYDGSGHGDDEANAIAMDASGNVYVTGSSPGDQGNCDYATIKYDASGNQQWVARYDNGYDDNAYAIAVDASGNVYVTGISVNSAGNYGYATIKYGPNGGDPLWVARYDNGSDDEAYAIALDASGNVYVTGIGVNSAGNYGYATIKYGPNGGDPLWIARYDNKSYDCPAALGLDASGNVYVTGVSDDDNWVGDYATVKYDPSGTQQWAVRYDNNGNEYDAYDIAVDASGNAYVTGVGYGDAGGDYVTVKYDPSGTQKWVASYDNGYDDEACAIALDASGNVFVTGVSDGAHGIGDYATVKYDGNGKQQWVARYDSGGYDIAEAIGTDASGNAYVTGYSQNSGLNFDYASVVYDGSGNELQVARYDNGYGDDAYAIAVDAAGNFCVTGASIGSGTGEDYATVAYKVGRPDMGVSSIDAPVGIPAPGSLVPQASVYNCGTGQSGFYVVFRIDCTPPYVETVHVPNGIPPESDPPIVFPAWAATDGYYTAKCSTITPRDQDPANDAKTLDFIVAPPGWTSRTALPKTPSGKDEDAGGWLAYNSGDKLIYAAKGNSTADFYAFNPRTNSWTALAPIQKGREKALPLDGCRGVTDGGDKVYMTKGNSTLGFWSYTISTHTWTQLADVPKGNVTVQGGADLAYVVKDGVGYVYLLKGNGSEFYKYNTSTGLWIPLPDAPDKPHKFWPDGSWLVYDGNHTLYAHKAKYQELWAFDVASERWGSVQLPGIPERSGHTGKQEKAGSGSAGAWLDGAIYALKGNSTCGFWKYVPTDTAWTELDSMPRVGTSGQMKPVDVGGDITATENMLFAFKGNMTDELWRYVRRGTGGSDGPAAEPAALATRPSMELLPNPARARFVTLKYALPRIEPARMALVDVSGRVVANQDVPAASREGSLLLDLSDLRAGVYFARLEGKALSISQKLIIER